MITATLFLVFAVITILGMPIALALVGGGMAAIVAGDLMPLFTSVQKMFSSHPDSEKRATRMKEQADAYMAAQK